MPSALAKRSSRLFDSNRSSFLIHSVTFYSLSQRLWFRSASLYIFRVIHGIHERRIHPPSGNRTVESSWSRRRFSRPSVTFFLHIWSKIISISSLCDGTGFGICLPWPVQTSTAWSPQMFFYVFRPFQKGARVNSTNPPLCKILLCLYIIFLGNPAYAQNTKQIPND